MQKENTCQSRANGMDPALAARWNLERQLQPRRSVMQVVRIGLDLAKYVFAVHGVDARGKIVLPHQEAGYTSAVVTVDINSADLLQSGGVHIRPHMCLSRHGRIG
jgi:hypothetical protein